MSQRLGMADGRCFTINTSNRLINDYLMNQNNISLENNYKYRKLLQKMGPDLLKVIEQQQKSGPRALARGANSNHVNQCQSCDTPLLKVPDTY